MGFNMFPSSRPALLTSLSTAGLREEAPCEGGSLRQTDPEKSQLCKLGCSEQ